VPALPAQWPHALPFLAQRVIDRGVDLPNPYDVGVSVYLGREDRKLRSLNIGLNGGTPVDASFVQFPNSRVEPISLQVQAGAWVLPFLNVYAIGGYTHGTGDIDIVIPGADLMNFLKVPGCQLPLALRPALCSQTLSGTAHANYDGSTYGVGMTAAGAKGNFFGALPITYVISDLSISDTRGRTWNIAPRLGYNQRYSNTGMLTWYVGGTYLISDMDITGSFVFDTSNTVIGKPTTLSYSIHVEPKNPWNYLAGVNWTISRKWSVVAETGFGSSRSDILLTSFYRW